MASRKEIASIVNNLLSGFGKSGSLEYQRSRTPFPIADVEFDIERLNAHVYLWTRFVGVGYPCAMDKDGPIPLFSDITFWPNEFPDNIPSRDIAPGYYEVRNAARFYNRKEVKIIESSSEELRESVRSRLTQFLTVRSGGDETLEPRRRRAVGAAPSGFTTRKNPYLDFEVHTRETGLRVHYTPSYFIDWSNVFGSPTTPATGWLLPGRYKFGAMRPSGEFLIDNANFDVPPTTAAHLVLR